MLLIKQIKNVIYILNIILKKNIVIKAIIMLIKLMN